MKTKILSGAVAAILGLAVGSISAQTQTTTTTTNYIETSKLIGTKVRAAQGDEVGTIKDVVLDNNGCMAYTVLATGGTSSRVSSTTKTVAVPWSVYETTSFAPDSRVVTVRVDRDRIYNAPVFDYAHVREYSNPGWINQVNSYYGVGPSAGVGVGISTGTNTTTYNNGSARPGYSGYATESRGANTAASPANSPYGANASSNPSPATSPATNAAPAMGSSPATAASPAKAASPQPSANASPSSRSGQSASTEQGQSSKRRGHSGTSSSSRHHASPSSENASETAAESNESGTASKTSGNERKKSSRHSTRPSSEGSAETSSTPKTGGGDE